jgi:hypothetical protein
MGQKKRMPEGGAFGFLDGLPVMKSVLEIIFVVEIKFYVQTFV